MTSFPLNRVFASVRKVLQGACHMVSLQLAAEPLVRQAVRQVFQTRALLNVKPTKKGKKVCIYNGGLTTCLIHVAVNICMHVGSLDFPLFILSFG